MMATPLPETDVVQSVAEKLHRLQVPISVEMELFHKVKNVMTETSVTSMDAQLPVNLKQDSVVMAQFKNSSANNVSPLSIRQVFHMVAEQIVETFQSSVEITK